MPSLCPLTVGRCFLAAAKTCANRRMHLSWDPGARRGTVLALVITTYHFPSKDTRDVGWKVADKSRKRKSPIKKMLATQTPCIYMYLVFRHINILELVRQEGLRSLSWRFQYPSSIICGWYRTRVSVVFMAFPMHFLFYVWCCVFSCSSGERLFKLQRTISNIWKQKKNLPNTRK
jgi:hypothetical protein